MNRKLISPSAYIERLRPYLNNLYQTALLITDDDEAAEEAMGEALMEAYLEDGGGNKQSQREKIRRYVRARSLERAGHSAGGGWRMGVPRGENALYDVLSMMDTSAQRYVMLRGFAGIPGAKAASMCALGQSEANGVMRQAMAAVPDGSEHGLVKMCREISIEPDMSGIERLFERDAVNAVRGRHRSRGIPAIVLSVIGIIICMLLFWIITVLLEPSQTLAFVKILSAV